MPQADTLEHLGYGSDGGTWRNFYLVGALEWRHGSVGTSTVAPHLLASERPDVEIIRALGGFLG